MKSKIHGRRFLLRKNIKQNVKNFMTSLLDILQAQLHNYTKKSTPLTCADRHPILWDKKFAGRKPFLQFSSQVHKKLVRK